ncbi:MAG: HAD family hydrolase [Thermoproteota archaeon]
MLSKFCAGHSRGEVGEGSLCPPIKYCIFDVLGSLFPWKESFRFLHIFSRIGLKSRLCEVELRKLFSKKIKEIFRSERGFESFIVEAYGVERDEVPRVVKQFDELLLSEAVIHPKAELILKKLSKSYSLLVCSDTTGSTKSMLEKAGVRKYFKREFYSNELHLTKEDGLHEIILQTYPAAKPWEFVSIGDSNSDIVIPKKIGMRTIWIRNQALGPLKVEPDIVIDDLGEVIVAVENLSNDRS